MSNRTQVQVKEQVQELVKRRAKRQSIRRKLRQKQNARKAKLALEQKKLEQIVWTAKLGHAKPKPTDPCWINKTAEGVLCLIFTFLDLCDHCNLSRSSTKMERISLLWQASPTQVDLSKLMKRPGIIECPDEVKMTIVRRLMLELRPSQLIVPLNFGIIRRIGLEKIAQIPSLRELTLKNSLSSWIEPLELNIEWAAQLTRLTKLIIPVESLLAVTPMPSSLMHLELVKRVSGGFYRFDSDVLFKSIHLEALQGLQVLKLPNNYSQLKMLGIGKILPALRELSLGYFDVQDRKQVDFTPLQSCTNLQVLTVGVDWAECTCRWETLAAIPLLRRLTISIYQTGNPADLFMGLPQVTQLTHLTLIPHRGRGQVSISFPVLESFTPPALLAEATSVSVAKLTSLSISYWINLRNAKALSAFETLEELELPPGTSEFVAFPRLHTLHVDKRQTNLLDYYKDQLTTVFYKDDVGNLDQETGLALNVLLKMKKLTTLKLHPRCTFAGKDGHLSIFAYFKQQLPSTVRVEIDYSMEDVS